MRDCLLAQMLHSEADTILRIGRINDCLLGYLIANTTVSDVDLHR
jgi:hypothetical protein